MSFKELLDHASQTAACQEPSPLRTKFVFADAEDAAACLASRRFVNGVPEQKGGGRR